MKNIFTSVPTDRVGKNVFDLTHDRKFSCKMGELIPVCCIDTVPGDQFSIKGNAFVRFAPMIAPVMHNVSVYIHYFFVPNRLTWPNWEDFITGGEDGTAAPVWPYMEKDLSLAGPGSLYDHMGLPVGDDANSVPPSSFLTQYSAFPMAAYQKIFNEYYRDQNLVQENVDTLVDGLNTEIGSRLAQKNKRAWQHDYFTSALPWAQKGPEALLPLGTEAPIVFSQPEAPSGQLGQTVKDAVTNQPLAGTANTLGWINTPALGQLSDGGLNPTYLDLNGTYHTDLTQATAASVSDLRRAVKLQEWLEKNARGGSRYTESIKVHFGVNSSDSRLQRPEYLGGISSPVKVSEVLQTGASQNTATVPPSPIPGTPQGNMAGHAMSIGSGDYVSHYCEEHGYIMGIMSIMPQSAYQQGMPRHFSRKDKFDYFWPEFQHIGEEAILKQELYLGANATPGPPEEKIFGYKPRYAEYKYIPSTVHGQFRDTLDFWHMGRKFASEPELNEDFISMDYQEVDRIFAVNAGEGADATDNMWCHILNEVKAKRPMAYFGEPKW